MNLLLKRVLHMKLPYTNSLLLVLTAFSHMKDVATINYVGKFLEFFLQVLEFCPKNGKEIFPERKENWQKFAVPFPFRSEFSISESFPFPFRKFRKDFRKGKENFVPDPSLSASTSKKAAKTQNRFRFFYHIFFSERTDQHYLADKHVGGQAGV